MSKPRGLTPYQTEILDLVRDGCVKNEPVDLDQLLDTLSWKPTKQSLQFTIRALIAKNVMAKTDCIVRRARKRVCFILTLEGMAVYDPREPAPVLKKEDMEVLIQEVNESTKRSVSADFLDEKHPETAEESFPPGVPTEEFFE